jgi:hypothetical protein
MIDGEHRPIRERTMTSGQDSGSYGEPSDRPDGSPAPGGQPPSGPPAEGSGWAPAPPAPPSYPPQNNPPQGYPPQGAPPQGYPQAPGYPPAPGPGYGYPPAPGQGYGYGPAPSVPQGYGAPPAVERPTTVQAAVVCFIAYIVLNLISAIIQFSDIDNLVAQTLANAGSSASTISRSAIRTTVIVGGVIGLLFAALEGMFIWFAWNGRNWARIVLWVIGGLGVVSGLIGLGGSVYLSGFLRGLSIFSFLLVLAGVVLLALKPSNEWYRYRGWLRATGQRG